MNRVLYSYKKVTQQDTKPVLGVSNRPGANPPGWREAGPWLDRLAGLVAGKRLKPVLWLNVWQGRGAGRGPQRTRASKSQLAATHSCVAGSRRSVSMAQALQRLLLSPAEYDRIEGLINQERAQQGLPPLIHYPVIPPDEAETAFALIEEEAKSSGPLARTAGLFLRLLAWAASVFGVAVGDDDGDATMGADVFREAPNDAVAQAVRDVPVPAPPHQNERPTTVAGRAARKRSAAARSPFAAVDQNATAPGAAQPPPKRRGGLRPRTRPAAAQMDADDAAFDDDDEDWTGEN